MFVISRFNLIAQLLLILAVPELVDKGSVLRIIVAALVVCRRLRRILLPAI